MFNKSTLRAALLAGALSLLATGTAAAQTYGTNGGANYLPFGCGGCYGSPYQQVYTNGPFGTSPVSINSITFYSDGTAWAGNTFTYRLSTTTAAENALSNIQASNVGADDALFATVTPTGTFSGAFTTTGTPFTYDPTAGNLLLQIFISGTGDGSYTALQFSYSASDGTSRNYGAGTDQGGLVTTFTTSPVTATPEPTSMVLSATGLLGVLGLARRRRVA